jgi:hypothetical protein
VILAGITGSAAGRHFSEWPPSARASASGFALPIERIAAGSLLVACWSRSGFGKRFFCVTTLATLISNPGR